MTIKTCFAACFAAIPFRIRPISSVMGRRDSLDSTLDVNKDEFHHVCDSWWNPQDIQNHPDVLEVAKRLGYDPLDFDEQKLRRRYFPYC